MKFLAFLVVGFSACVEAQEIVTLQTRPGVAQSFFIAGMGQRKAEAAAILLIVADIRAVRAELEKRYPGLPVFIVGTSRSTLSAAHLARSLPGESKGAVLTSSLFYSGGGGARARQVLAAYRFGKEAETVDAIAAWMLGKPYPEEIR